MPLAAAPVLAAMIGAGGTVAGAAIAKKKGKTQKQMEALQYDLAQKAAQRQTQLQPVHDSILRAYSSMLSPQGNDVNASMGKALPATTSPNYYGNPGGSEWWGTPPNVPGQRRPPSF